ncbi:PREDICTED: uncharacterized protein LOC104588814 [Nelumbo nucifera]|uniref:Uncharacterized protein LOC104588814 n=2 Tax=Nelumbo nucifera TaxID=4432 RepID=A0A1U7YXD4_NELNU|nr:PREDICTED: uncharacterized protein LOC104588814 [Nelumbo nucifera]DAD17856.1 TPA_asm: hypothetical protein HUJ06_019319 [Nelumbo nucifera]
MVLWEITLGTAYFLGLKRTYKLVLKIQRRLISPRHVRLRQFVYRRTRAVFDIALKVHRNIQERDIEVGRNVGNWILRWLDRMKPSANIRGDPPPPPSGGNGNMTKHVTNTSSGRQPQGPVQRSSGENGNRGINGRVSASSMNIIWRKSFPTLGTMMFPAKPVGTNVQYRHLFFCGPEMQSQRLNCAKGSGFEGVIRKDILQWMLPN